MIKKNLYQLCKIEEWKKQARKIPVEGSIHIIEVKESTEKDILHTYWEILAACYNKTPFFLMDPSITKDFRRDITKILNSLRLEKDIFALFFTSGSSGKPKPIQITNEFIINSAKADLKIMRFNKNITFTNSVPIAWRFGATTFVYLCLLGAKFRFIKHSNDFREIVTQLVKKDIGYYPTNGYQWLKIIKVLKENNIKLNLASHPLSFISREIIKDLQEYTKSVILSYGLTEAGYTAMRTKYLEDCYQCVGKPTKGSIIKIVNSKDKECKIGDTGEIEISGEFVSPSASNPFKTGDIGYKDKKGYLYVLGRKEEILKIRGFKVSTSQMEAVYKEYNTSAFGIETNIPGWQEAVVVFETKEPLRKIKKYVNSIDPPVSIYCFPKWIFTMKKFPLTTTKKIDKQKIISLFTKKINLIKFHKLAKEKSASNKVNLKASIFQRVYKIFKEILEINSFELNDNFISLGGDSLKIAQLQLSLKKEFDINLSIEKIFRNLTVKKIAELVLNKKKNEL